MEMTYILPEEYFYSHKVGTRGVGPIAEEYMEEQKPLYVKSKNEVDKLFNHKGSEKNDDD